MNKAELACYLNEAEEILNCHQAENDILQPRFAERKKSIEEFSAKILFVGGFSSGKSALLNSFLGDEEILCEDIPPETAVSAELIYSPVEKIVCVTNSGENYEYGRETNPESILGVEAYEMPTQGDNITAQVGQLKKGWEKVIPQIGGALKNKFGLTPVISSAARSAEHNTEVGGSKTSHHIIRDDGGDALDIVFDEDTTAEQQQQIADYFKDTGLFKEILYHDVGSGAHLHLGGLNVDKLNAPKAETGTSNGGENISATATETPAERTPFVDNVIKDLLSDNTPVEFNIESPNHLTQAVYNDFVFDKLHNDTSAESDINQKFFSTHSELFDKDNNFINTPKNRATVTEQFGADEITDFGPSAERFYRRRFIHYERI